MVRTHAMELVTGAGSTVWSTDTRERLTKRVSCAMGRGVSLQYIWVRGKRVSWCELVRVNEDRGEAIDEQGSRTYIKIGPGAGENGSKGKETRLTRGAQEQEWVDR
jgi:hypothetical protein